MPVFSSTFSASCCIFSSFSRVKLFKGMSRGLHNTNSGSSSTIICPLGGKMGLRASKVDIMSVMLLKSHNVTCK